MSETTSNRLTIDRRRCDAQWRSRKARDRLTLRRGNPGCHDDPHQPGFSIFWSTHWCQGIVTDRARDSRPVENQREPRRPTIVRETADGLRTNGSRVARRSQPSSQLRRTGTKDPARRPTPRVHRGMLGCRRTGIPNRCPQTGPAAGRITAESLPSQKASKTAGSWLFRRTKEPVISLCRNHRPVST